MRIRICQPISETLDLRHLTKEEKDHIDRTFWTNVHKKGYKDCWRYGYQAPLRQRTAGGVYFHGKQWKAHRFSWALHHGILAEGSYLWHSCGVANCVNPDHLICGDRAQMLAWHANQREVQRAMR